MDTLFIIEEIINKECERYELEKGGFVSDRKELIRLVTDNYPKFPDSNCTQEYFENYKDKVLTYLYTQKDYATFFHRKRNDRFIHQLIKRLIKNSISSIRKENTKATIDQEMRLPRKRTLAFKLSATLFTKTYSNLFTTPVLFTTPEQIEHHCETSVKKLYPINYTRLMEYLKHRDDEFWMEIIYIVRQFCFYLTRHEQPGSLREELKKEIEMESILSVQEQMKKNKLCNLESATHLFYSLRTTCRNKLLEYYHRRTIQKENLLNNEDWDIIAQRSENNSLTDMYRMEFEDRFSYLQDLNPENDYELSCAIVDVLCHGKGKIYQLLVKQDDQKIAVLMMHSYEGKEYEEIAMKLYGYSNSMTCAALRQTVTRIKRQLKKRMKNIIQQFKK